jgi:hypothetical protein
MSVPAGYDSRDAVANPSVTNHRAAVTSISFTEQPRQLLSFGQTCTFLEASMIQLVVRSSLAKGFSFFSSVETRLRNSFMTL